MVPSAQLTRVYYSVRNASKVLYFFPKTSTKALLPIVSSNGYNFVGPIVILTAVFSYQDLTSPNCIQRTIFMTGTRNAFEMFNIESNSVFSRPSKLMQSQDHPAS
jgi:hypothetical protein